jgi:hypothetical protein
MKRLTSVSLAIFICFCLILATDRRGWGYVDPGSGLIALQTFASVTAACGYFLRRHILGLFGKKEKVGATKSLPVVTKEGDLPGAA